MKIREMMKKYRKRNYNLLVNLNIDIIYSII